MVVVLIYHVNCLENTQWINQNLCTPPGEPSTYESLLVFQILLFDTRIEIVFAKLVKKEFKRIERHSCATIDEVSSPQPFDSLIPIHVHQLSGQPCTLRITRLTRLLHYLQSFKWMRTSIRDGPRYSRRHHVTLTSLLYVTFFGHGVTLISIFFH